LKDFFQTRISTFENTKLVTKCVNEIRKVCRNNEKKCVRKGRNDKRVDKERGKGKGQRARGDGRAESVFVKTNRGRKGRRSRRIERERERDRQTGKDGIIVLCVKKQRGR